MPTGVIEVDRSNEAVVDGSEDIDVVGLEVLHRRFEGLDGLDLQRQVLGPVRILLLLDDLLIGHVEEGGPAAIGHLEEDVGVGSQFLGGRHSILHDGVGELQPENIAVELGGLLGISASVGHMIETLNLHSRTPHGVWSARLGRPRTMLRPSSPGVQAGTYQPSRNEDSRHE